MGLDNPEKEIDLAEGGDGAEPLMPDVTEGMLSNPHSPFVQFERRIGEIVRGWFAENVSNRYLPGKKEKK